MRCQLPRRFVERPAQLVAPRDKLGRRHRHGSFILSVTAVSAPGGQTRITQSSGPSLIVFIVGPEQKPGFDELPVYG